MAYSKFFETRQTSNEDASVWYPDKTGRMRKLADFTAHSDAVSVTAPGVKETCKPEGNVVVGQHGTDFDVQGSF